MDLNAVERSYARWAPIYDRTFGIATSLGRRRAVALVNSSAGSVLEVGVGTGLALPLYDRSVTVTGIDFSEDMLSKARTKVACEGLKNVASLQRMDARKLGFPDNSFDQVVAMHVLSVVPEPEKVVAEMARVCRPNGTVLIVNHFARKNGALATAERLAAPLADILGWHSDFDRTRVLRDPRLALVEELSLPPIGMMTLLRLVKGEAAQPAS